MRLRSLELSIPAPCHENWDAFTPTEKGGFCARCQKEVIDFTTWSDEAVLAYFADRKKIYSGANGKNLKIRDLNKKIPGLDTGRV